MAQPKMTMRIDPEMLHAVSPTEEKKAEPCAIVIFGGATSRPLIMLICTLNKSL